MTSLCALYVRTHYIMFIRSPSHRPYSPIILHTLRVGEVAIEHADWKKKLCSKVSPLLHPSFIRTLGTFSSPSHHPLIIFSSSSHRPLIVSYRPSCLLSSLGRVPCGSVSERRCEATATWLWPKVQEALSSSCRLEALSMTTLLTTRILSYCHPHYLHCLLILS